MLRNRGSGPVAILGTVDERCGGVFDEIDDVIPHDEIESFMARYKAAAGFAAETLNTAREHCPRGQRSTRVPDWAEGDSAITRQYRLPGSVTNV